jgi:hypothetical protein
MSETQSDVEERRPVHFTIDGKPFTVEDHEQKVEALLRLAGLDPANYDLAKVRVGKEPERFSADQTIRVHQDEEFVTIRHSAPVE